VPWHLPRGQASPGSPIGGGATHRPPGLTISQENALSGTALPTITGAGDTNNLGFAREFSINAGNTQSFSCDGTSTVIDIYRIGYYGGVGARLVQAGIANTATAQPTPTTITGSNSATTCTAWSTTATWAIPADVTSGFYVAVYRNSGNTTRSYIPFIVRRDDRPASICYKTSDTTWALAYNNYGTPADPLAGRSYYGTYNSSGVTTWDIANRGHAATYHRPIMTRGSHSETYWLNAERALITFLERNGWDLTYTASKDWGEWSGAPTPAQATIYISSGHDEYWSTGMNTRWKALRDAGKHLLFMSGNERFWRTRFPTDGNTQWCYKDTMTGPGGHTAGTALDPVTWTGTWRDTRTANDATRDSEWNLTGCDFRMNGINNFALNMDQSSTILDHAFWRNSTAPTGGLNIAGIVGFEADDMRPQQPVGSRATLASVSITLTDIRADDNGEFYNGDGTLSWGVVSQRYASGAVVVGFGTCQWSWGLDNSHDNGSAVASTAMQQATLNLLVDLGAVPATPMGTLTVPTPVSLDNYGAIP